MNKRTALILNGVVLLWSAILFAQAWWGHWLFMGILAGGALVILATWLHRRSRASSFTLVPASLLLLYYAGLPGKIVQFLTLGKTSDTYDAVLLYVDRSFGFSPSLLVCHWVGLVPHLNEFFFAVYMSLSIAMGACFAAHLGESRPPWRIVAILFATATIGVVSYNLLPACGPLMLLGRNEFLHGDAVSAGSAIQPTLVSIAINFPRNAMPSLHMSWALLLLWINRDLKRGAWLSAIFAALTAVATLSTGEHYLVDLVVAFPFSYAIWNLFTGELPLSHPKRNFSIAAGACAFLAWIAAIRLSPGIFYASPVVPWMASAITVAATLYGIYRRPVADFCAQKESVPSEMRIVERAV